MATGDGLLARLTPPDRRSRSTPSPACARRRADARQRHHRDHLARQHPDPGLERGVGAAVRRGRGIARDRGERRHSGADRSAGRPDRRRHPRRPCARRVIAEGSRRCAVRSSPVGQGSVVIDGGAALHLDGLRRTSGCEPSVARHVHVALAGDAATATPLGAVPLERAVECVVRLFETLAATAPQSRMREAIEGEGLNAFKSAVADLLVDMPAPAAASALPIRSAFTRLSSGGNALGVGLPFGHSDSETLVALDRGAPVRPAQSGVRTAPGRALLLLGLSPGATRQLIAEARRVSASSSIPPIRAARSWPAPARRSARRARSPRARWRPRSPTPRGRCPMARSSMFPAAPRAAPIRPRAAGRVRPRRALRRVRRRRADRAP